MTTEPLVRRATWSTPLLLAPCGAALFAATVWWAAATPATTQSGSAAGTRQAAPNVRPAVAGRHGVTAAEARALHRRLQHGHRQAIRLEQRLRALRTESVHLHVAIPKIPVAGPAAPPPVQAAPAPPPVNTVTGASG